jgi:hypothetical protein
MDTIEIHSLCIPGRKEGYRSLSEEYFEIIQWLYFNEGFVVNSVDQK